MAFWKKCRSILSVQNAFCKSCKIGTLSTSPKTTAFAAGLKIFTDKLRLGTIDLECLPQIINIVSLQRKIVNTAHCAICLTFTFFLRCVLLTFVLSIIVLVSEINLGETLKCGQFDQIRIILWLAARTPRVGSLTGVWSLGKPPQFLYVAGVHRDASSTLHAGY